MPWSVSRSGMKEHQLATFRRLDRLGPGPMLGALDRVGHETLQVWRASIQRGVSATGQVFTALSPAYRRRKEREFPGQAILVRTGELLRSLCYGLVEKHKFVYQLFLGASGQRAFTVLMQVTGTRRGRGGAAARDFTRMPRGWFRARLLAGVEALGPGPGGT
jgi:hypothetical protein